MTRAKWPYSIPAARVVEVAEAGVVFTGARVAGFDNGQ